MTEFNITDLDYVSMQGQKYGIRVEHSASGKFTHVFGNDKNAAIDFAKENLVEQPSNKSSDKNNG